MLWSTLWNRLGKQKLKVMQHNHVYAILENPKTHQWEKVNLCLKFDATGRPYFIKEIPKKRSSTKHHTQNKGDTHDKPYHLYCRPRPGY